MYDSNWIILLIYNKYMDHIYYINIDSLFFVLHLN